ncbi:MAG: hypothetical protein WD072_00480 [Pirellulales bacterium]
MRTIAFAVVVTAAFLPLPIEAASVSFEPRIVTFGETREQIKSTPITERPNRPLHVYGNSIRRRQQRDAIPTAPRESQR